MKGSISIDRLRGRGGTAVVLGSGLRCGPIGGRIRARIPYGEIEGMPVPSVAGHPGTLTVIDTTAGPFYLLAGRMHLYEGGGEAASAADLVARLGADRMILTHAAGSLSRSLPPGSWILASGIVSLPWRGAGGSGCRAPLIDRALRGRVLEAAGGAGVPLREGVLYWTAGPSYETPAEAAAATMMGAVAATMSPLPELATSRDAGIPAVSLAWITNWAPNVSGFGTDHRAVVAAGPRGSAGLTAILRRLAAGPQNP